MTTQRRIRRIVVTGDVLRPLADRAGEPATRNNAAWLHRLLAYPLRQVCSLPVDVVNWGDGIDSAAIYRAFDLPPTIDSWARIHYAHEMPRQAAAQIEAAFADSVVIACEITPCLARALTGLGVPVIDTVGYPIRFLDDLLNAWRTNDAEVDRALQPFRYDLALAHLQAGLIAAKMAWLPPLDVPPDSCLLIGQVGGDKALIHKQRGRLLSFADFAEDLFRIAEAHGTVFYKPHPYQGVADESRNVAARFKSFRRIDTNFYRLLAQRNLAAVYAISSGTCAEAPYFGKRARCFYEPLYDVERRTPDDFGLGGLVPVEHEWLWPRFWRALLAPLVPVTATDFPALAYRPNRIRRSLNADWGFGAVDAVVSTALA